MHLTQTLIILFDLFKEPIYLESCLEVLHLFLFRLINIETNRKLKWSGKPMERDFS